MIQLLPKCAFNAGYGGGTSHIGVLGGNGDFSGPGTFGVNFAKAPVALDSTFRNLTVLATTPFAANVTITLLVDGVASAQTVTLATGESTAVSVGADVVVTAEQDITYKYVGPVGGGTDLAFCIEREGEGNIFGLTPISGSIVEDAGCYGGAFNNGTMQSYAPPPTPGDSNTYSITATDGTVTTLTIRTYAGAPGVGVWTAWMKVDGVIQDGAGATVDTSVSITAAETVASSTFSLPVTIGQHVEVVVLRTALAAPFALAQVAIGVGFEPDTADVFMLCGGSNDTVSSTAVGWKWTLSEQLATPETANVAPISATGLTALGLYIERGDAPGAGTSYVHTLRRSGSDTLAVVTLANLETSGLISDLDESYASGQTITLQSLPVPDGVTPPAISRLYWGLAAFSGTTPEPTPVYETRSELQRRLRRAPHLSEEQRWMFHHRLQIDLEAGVGLVDGQGEDPQVMVRWSNDGGHTWSNEHWYTAGAMGQYTRRVIVRQLGRARDRVYEVVVSDPVSWHLIDAFLDVTPGRH